MAQELLHEPTDGWVKFRGTNFRMKTAYLPSLEDRILDFYALEVENSRDNEARMIAMGRD